MLSVYRVAIVPINMLHINFASHKESWESSEITGDCDEVKINGVSMKIRLWMKRGRFGNKTNVDALINVVHW